MHINIYVIKAYSRFYFTKLEMNYAAINPMKNAFVM